MARRAMTPEHKEMVIKALRLNRAQGGLKRRVIGHTVRTRDNGRKYFARYGARLAIACFCMECLGWEDAPDGCTSPLCALYPYRKRTLSTQKGDKQEDPF